MEYYWHGSCYMKILDITMEYYSAKNKELKKDERKLFSLKVHYRQIHNKSYPIYLTSFVRRLYYICKKENFLFVLLNLNTSP